MAEPAGGALQAGAPASRDGARGDDLPRAPGTGRVYPRPARTESTMQ